MKRFVPCFLALLLLLTACSGPEGPAENPSGDPEPTPVAQGHALPKDNRDAAGTGAVFTDDLPLHTPLTLQETPALLLNRPSACIAAWRRTLFTDTGIRFRARGWGEDLCMTRKMLTAARSVVILPDVLYLYRQHEGSVTKRALDANAEIMDAIDDVLTWYQARGLFEQYENELGKLCVDNVLYDASVRILKAQSAHPLLPQLLDFTAARFPDYRHNPYLKGYPARKKLVLSLLGKKQYRAVHLLFAAAGH